MEKEIITKKQADEMIIKYEKNVKEMMIHCGLDVGDTPHAEQARADRRKNLDEYLKSKK